ncbi:MAG: hypothetical protein JXP73_04865 [Deltaproteobacteria bacterium]|jgi:hypothetical protein|nr:hypothetical protein [Deltaproteobacteria bacterium]
MNAQIFTRVRVGLTVTSLALCGALALSVSCAGGGGGEGGSGGGGGSTGGEGGSGGGGGGVGPCSPEADSVCFASGKAEGVLSGYGWVALGVLDTITSPTCDNTENGGGASEEITKEKPCPEVGGKANWSSDNALCLTASIPALPASPVQKDYDDNWGVSVGFNSSEPPGTVIGDVAKDYKTITYHLTGSPLSGLRGQVHLISQPEDKSYCANISVTDGKATATLTSFGTECWGGSNNVKLTADDLPNIDKVMVQVSSTSSAITVDNLCLTGVSFGK